MQRQNCFIKLSGDMQNDNVLKWIKTLTKKYFVVICVGGGTQINEAFKEAGLNEANFGPLGRETNSFQERQLARDILEKNQAQLQDRLAKMGIHANVILPVVELGTVLCHVNGDQMVLAAYLGFDLLYVVTTEARVKAKKQLFGRFPKVRIINF